MPTLQSYIDSAIPYSRITPPAGIYRELVTISKPGLVLDGSYGVELRGSDVWADWAGSNPWVSTLTIPSFPIDPNGPTWNAAHTEQVFLDGIELLQVASNPAIGQFALDAARHVLLMPDPTGHTIEVTTRPTWILNQAPGTTITHTTFRHAATQAQGHAIGNDGMADWALTYCTLTDVHGSMVGPGQYGKCQILHNTIARAGDVGIIGYKSDQSLIAYNDISACGFGGYAHDFATGAIKLATSISATVDHNNIFNCNGGIWYDIACMLGIISNNRVDKCANPSVSYEISSGGHIYNNTLSNTSTLENTTAIHILVSSSGHVEVDHNTVMCTPSGEGVVCVLANRIDKLVDAGTNVNVHDNIIVSQEAQAGIRFWDYGSGVVTNPASNNHSLNNQCWYIQGSIWGSNL